MLLYVFNLSLKHRGSIILCLTMVWIVLILVCEARQHFVEWEDVVFGHGSYFRFSPMGFASSIDDFSFTNLAE